MNTLKQAIAAAGNRSQLASFLKISRQAVNKWTRIPAERVVDVEKATGIPREKLRPDLYRRQA